MNLLGDCFAGFFFQPPIHKGMNPRIRMNNSTESLRTPSVCALYTHTHGFIRFGKGKVKTHLST
jgi:hypothetical protein